MHIYVKPLDEVIKKTIEKSVYSALLATNGNKLQAAKLLEINRNTLSKYAKGVKFKKHNIRIKANELPVNPRQLIQNVVDHEKSDQKKICHCPNRGLPES